jgi:hypothetical protein
MTTTKPPEPPLDPIHIIEQLNTAQGIPLLTELGELMQKANQATLATGKTASVTLTITTSLVKGATMGAVLLTGQVKAKIPPAALPGKMFFTTPAGNLSTDNNQAMLPLNYPIFNTATAPLETTQ